MTLQEFTGQMERLKENWPKQYSNERAKLIYQTVASQPSYWFERTVSELIGSRRQAPLVPDFLDQVRDYETRRKSKQNEVRGGGSVTSILEHAARKSDNREFARVCVRAVTDPKITHEQFQNEVLPYVEQAAKVFMQESKTCYVCNGGGYVTHENTVYRCHCKVGKDRPQIAYGPTRQDGTRDEVFIQIWSGH